jgi:cytochrome c
MKDFKIGVLVILVALVFIGSTEPHAAEIHNAARSGDIQALRALLSQGEEIDKQSSEGTALHVAISAGRKDIAELLIAEGADVNEEKALLGTALHIAALKGSADLAALLIAKGANIEATNNWGRTPLHMAAEFGHLEVVKVLARSGADVNIASKDNDTALHLAAVNEHDEIMTFLVESGARPPEIRSVSDQLSGASESAGEKAAGNCRYCHKLREGQGTATGPVLWDIVGRRIAAIDTFPYSPAMRRLGGTWTYEALNQFIANPKGYVPGTKMLFKGIADFGERADIIAFLRQLSDQPKRVPK